MSTPLAFLLGAFVGTQLAGIGLAVALRLVASVLRAIMGRSGR